MAYMFVIRRLPSDTIAAWGSSWVPGHRPELKVENEKVPAEVLEYIASNKVHPSDLLGELGPIEVGDTSYRIEFFSKNLRAEYKRAHPDWTEPDES